MKSTQRFMLVAFLVGACGAHAKTRNEAADQAAISKALQASAAAWSRGDLAAFMLCYDDSPNTEYVKSTGVVEGFPAIRDMYAARYGNGHSMGKLTLEIASYRQLGAAYALVTGRFSLTRPKGDGGDAAGLFSLVFHRSKSGWHIIYDHSS